MGKRPTRIEPLLPPLALALITLAYLVGTCLYVAYYRPSDSFSVPVHPLDSFRALFHGTPFYHNPKPPMVALIIPSKRIRPHRCLPLPSMRSRSPSEPTTSSPRAPRHRSSHTFEVVREDCAITLLRPSLRRSRCKLNPADSFSGEPRRSEMSMQRSRPRYL